MSDGISQSGNSDSVDNGARLHAKHFGVPAKLTMGPQGRTELMLKIVKMVMDPPCGIKKVHFEPSTSIGQPCVVYYEGHDFSQKIYAVSIQNMSMTDQIVIGQDVTDVIQILLTTRDSDAPGYDNKLDVYIRLNGQTVEDISKALHAAAVHGVSWPLDIANAIFGTRD